MTDIKWRAAICEDVEPFTNGITSIVPRADEPHQAARAIEVIAEDYFRSENDWHDLFGDDRHGRIEIRVTEPPHIAGNWLVTLELQVHARAEKL